MEKESIKTSISDYRFLKLLVSTIILRGENPIFENKQLQKDLYIYYDKEDLHFLFEDICKKESIEKNNYLDLNKAINQAYAWGLLLPIQDNNLKSFINLSYDDALENISQYEIEEINAIWKLTSYLEQNRQAKKILDKNK